MKAIVLPGPSLDGLHLSELPTPERPSAGRAIVRLRAASLNYIDLTVASGHYPGALYPNVPVTDGAGEVVAIGDDVWQVAVGDRVCIHSKPRWTGGPPLAPSVAYMRGVTAPGSLVEYAEVDATALVRVPDGLDWVEAASLPIPVTTAWNALEAARVRPGSTVVTLGTGGTSLFLLQLAKARGARVIVTSSSDEKLERVKALGADAVHNYRRDPDWDRFVINETGGLGADLVMDTAGSETFGRSIAAARQGGTVFAIGFVTGANLALELMPLIVKALRIQGNNTGSVADLGEAVQEVAASRINPVIDTVFEPGMLADAYRRQQGGAHFGKVVVQLDW